MSFCKYCGKKLEDGAFCDCEEAVSNRTQVSEIKLNAQEYTASQPQGSIADNAQNNAQPVYQHKSEPYQSDPIGSPQPMQAAALLEKQQPYQEQVQVQQSQPMTGQQTQAYQSQPMYGQQPQYQGQPMYGQQPQYQGQPNYQTAPGNNISGSVKKLPQLIVSYWKDSRQTVETIKASNENVVISGLLIAVMFIAAVISTCLTQKGMIQAVLGEYARWLGISNDFSFIRAVLTSLVLTVAVAVLYVIVRLAAIKIFSSQPNTKALFLDSVVEFAVHSIPVSAALIVAGIGMFLSYHLWFAVVGFITLFLIVTLVTEIKISVPVVKNNFIFLLAVSLLILAAVYIVFNIVFRMGFWCSGLSNMDISDLF